MLPPGVLLVALQRLGDVGSELSQTASFKGMVEAR